MSFLDETVPVRTTTPFVVVTDTNRALAEIEVSDMIEAFTFVVSSQSAVVCCDLTPLELLLLLLQQQLAHSRHIAGIIHKFFIKFPCRIFGLLNSVH